MTDNTTALSVLADVASIPLSQTTAPAGVVCIAPLRLAVTDEEERAWRELALAERKVTLSERQERLRIEIREREQKLDIERGLATLDEQKRANEMKYLEMQREGVRKRQIAQIEAETDPSTLKMRAHEAAVIRLAEAVIIAPTAQRALAAERPLIDRLLEMGSFQTAEQAQQYVSTLWPRGRAASMPPLPSGIQPRPAFAVKVASKTPP